MNIQVIADSDANLLHGISPTPGSMHDRRSFAVCSMDKIVPLNNTIGDLGHIGCGIIVGFKTSQLRDLIEDEKSVNRALALMRCKIEQVITHLKNWKILPTGYRGRMEDLSQVLRTITALEFFRRCW